MLLSSVLVTVAQSVPPAGIRPYFTAIITRDIDSSINWYSTTLGFSVVGKTESKEHGFKQANLQSGELLLELIELESAVNQADVIPGYSSKTRVTGLFKTGYQVDDFQQWMTHLESLKTEFHGNVVTDKITGKRMVILLDPDGNRIQLFEK